MLEFDEVGTSQQKMSTIKKLSTSASDYYCMTFDEPDDNDGSIGSSATSKRPSDCSLDEAVRGVHKHVQIIAQENMDLNDKLIRQSEELAEARAQLRGYNGPLGLGEHRGGSCRASGDHRRARPLLSSLKENAGVDGTDGKNLIRSLSSSSSEFVAASTPCSSVYHSCDHTSRWYWTHESSESNKSTPPVSATKNMQFVYPPNVNTFYSIRDIITTFIENMAKNLSIK